jgi:hypothetical protein
LDIGSGGGDGSSRSTGPYISLASNGRNLRLKIDESDVLYTKKDYTSWLLEPSLRRAPPNFIFFSCILASFGPSVEGIFTATEDRVPSTWILRPAFVPLSFRKAALLPGAKGKDLFYHLESRISQALGPYVPTNFRRPELGRTFFDLLSFDLFREGRRFLNTRLEKPDPLTEAFTALHLFTLSLALKEAKFPAGGLTLSEAQQAITNMQFLLAEASTPEGVLAMNDRPAGNIGRSLFLIGLDQIQGVLGFSVTKQEWVNRNVRRTALLYEVVEELFLIFVQWYNAHSSGLTLLAEASETFSDDEVASTVLLLNPATDLRDGASTLDERLFAWQERLTRRFGEERHQEILLNSTFPYREFLFAAPSKPPPTPSDFGRPGGHGFGNDPGFGGTGFGTRGQGRGQLASRRPW